MSISVIVPVYNSQDTIAACIESILNQSYTDFELIIVDDGSSDDSSKICDKYINRDHRIHVIHQENKGRTEARWVGVNQSTGDWICFVDSDDTLPVDSLRLLQSGISENTDIVLGNGYSLSPESRTAIPIDEFRHLAVRAEGTIGLPWGSLFRRNVVTYYLFDIPRHIMMGEDYIFWLRLVFSTEKPVHIVYESVYNKGEEHTCNTFHWTAEYCYELNELRKSAIPIQFHQEYFSDMIVDRLDNMYAIAVSESKHKWKNSQYYQDILNDTPLSLNQKVFFSLSGKWLRRNFSNKKLFYYLLLIIIGIVFFSLNLLDVPTLSDDMNYRFIFNEDNSAAIESINSISDLFHSLWVHYFFVNGRWVVHLLAQFFLIFVPTIITHCIHSVLFIILIHELVCWLSSNVIRRIQLVSIIFFLFFVVFSGIRTTMFWSLGTFNYLWVAVAIMSLLIWLRHIKNECIGYGHIFLSILAFFTGWSHEAISLPVSIAFITYIFINRHQIIYRAVLPYMLCFLLGTLMILISPSLWSRSLEGITFTNRLLSGAVNIVSNLRIFHILWLTLLFLFIKNKKLVWKHLYAHFYGYIALFISFVIVIFCGTNLERVGFFTDLIAMVLLLSLLLNVLSSKWCKILMFISCLSVFIFYIPAYIVRMENKQNWQFIENQMQTPQKELIAARYPLRGENLFMDFFRDHYSNPSIEFGYYCVYMAFNKDDINMRCAAHLYNKQQLIILPEDVIQRIESDSTAYKDYELDRHQSLYIHQLPEDKKVSKVIFELKPEDTSKLNILQRLLVYKDDTFVLDDDFHYKVVHINGRHYLIFTRPTTNIFRRIANIKYL